MPRQIIEDRQAIGIEEALENVGGISFLGNNDGRGLNFSIRGFGGFGSPILRDGFRLFGNDSVEPEIANLEQIEVLKGPASILYGQADPGGLINLVTKQPLSEPFYNLKLQFGNRDFVSPSVDFSGPLTTDGNLRYRFNALYRQEESFRNLDDKFNRIFVGPTLAWDIGDRTNLTVSLEYIKDDNPANFGTLAFGDGIADIPLELVTTNPEDTSDKRYWNVGYNLEHRFSENWKARSEFRYITDRYDFGVIALPFSLDESTGILTRVFAAQFSEADIYTLYNNVEAKFNVGSVKNKVLFGVDLSRTETNDATRFAPSPEFFSPLDIFNPDYSAVAPPAEEDIPIAFGGETTTDRIGIYLQNQIDILDNLILLAGARYDIVEQDTDTLDTDSGPGMETNQRDTAFTPRIGIVYQPIEPISLYANYAQSFNPNTATDAEGLPLE
ncbi:MAG: TonB-dependent receptor, partial [Prochloron sp. SP5CPC1]|nr:TonB-dependent receptor [Candidatus Paraprochloron terpiosi SP5CPC1]